MSGLGGYGLLANADAHRFQTAVVTYIADTEIELALADYLALRWSLNGSFRRYTRAYINMDL